ncbi:permease for cytosine/purines, uracil, thiamine, allantoin-domain-containing protein [Fusarium oxysporum]|nr:permease for cytosine/purines, uracil, thiamine, allantoin-domain-containing protein [Fusarium oxysporum]
MAVANLLKRIELPRGSRFINEDVRPVGTERRTWTFLTFHNFWLLINCNIATYLTGSALIPLGLTWWQAIIAIILGNILATAALILASLAGAYYHVGFPVFSRAVWGIWGSQFVIWNRIFLSLVWYGFQSWVGGQCTYLMLLSWDPNLEKHIPNTIPASTGMTSAQFVSYFIFCIVTLPFLWIKPHRIQKFFYFASSVTLVFFLVLLIWALATMGSDGFGDTLADSTPLPVTGGPQSVTWLTISGIMSTIGGIAAGILNQNDYARLSKKPGDAIWGQTVAFPLYSIGASVIGILVTAATQKRMGEAIWNPPTLLAALLAKDPTAGTRAAIFFAGLALSISQLGSNLPGNALAGGIDLASVFPKYINIRRGAYLMALLSPIVNPWRLVNTATVFLTVLSGYSVFLAPMTGLMVAHYNLVAKAKVNVDDLFVGNKDSIYWYNFGINWRAFVAWIVGVAPTMPGFIAAVNVNAKVSDGAKNLYQLNYLFGFVVSAAVYYGLHIVVPDKRFDAFIKDGTTAKEVQAVYDERWDMTYSESEPGSTEEHSFQRNKGPNSLTTLARFYTLSLKRAWSVLPLTGTWPASSEPCDACRRRKTACVITSEPPCEAPPSPPQDSHPLPVQWFTQTPLDVTLPASQDALSPASASASVSASGTSAISPSAPSEAPRHRSESAAVVHNGLVRHPVPVPGEGSLDRSISLDPPRLEPNQEVAYALEDVPGRTAHAMALGSEQDPYFLDAFRSVLLSEREGIDANFVQVYHGGPDVDDYPMHFLLLLDEFPDHKNEARQVASDAIERIVWPHGPALVRLYFRHVHVGFPVIHKTRFLRQYATAKLDIPSSLRGAVYALACVFWKQDATLAGIPCPFQQHELTNNAQEALRRELDAPNLSRLMSALLLMHMVPPEIDSVETPYVWVMACQATATAQMLGLHQDPDKWNIAPWEKRLRKKLWWAVFYTDCWSAVSHGNPPHISYESFTTPPPDMDDLRSGEDIPDDLRYMIDPEDATFRVSDGARFLEMITVSREMRAILDCSYGVRSTQQTRTQLIPIRDTLKEWPSLIPSCLAVRPYAHNAGPLHISFFATQVLLFRGLMFPATRAAKVTPGSNLQRWLSTALAEFELFTTFMAYITEEELTSFWGRCNDPRDIEAAYRLLEKFHQSLQRLGATEDVAAKVFLRPVILRIDSFFMQATELIKHGRTVVLEPPVMTVPRGES